MAVLFWVAGFDVIYSLQDLEFDRDNRVFSIPAVIGERGGLFAARILHLLSFLAFIGFGLAGQRIPGGEYFGWFWWVAVIFTGILLLVEHSLVKPGDHSRLGIAFFTLNGAISILLYLSVFFSVLPGGR